MTSVTTHSIVQNKRSSVQTNAKTMVKLYQYTVDLVYDKSNLFITWNCPFTGNNGSEHRNLVNLVYNEEPITRSAKYNKEAWSLAPFTIKGVAEGEKGTQKIDIEVEVDGGIFMAPFIDLTKIEAANGLDVVLTVLEVESS